MSRPVKTVSFAPKAVPPSYLEAGVGRRREQEISGLMETYRSHLAVVGGVVLEQLVRPGVPDLYTHRKKTKQKTEARRGEACCQTKTIR